MSSFVDKSKVGVVVFSGRFTSYSFTKKKAPDAFIRKAKVTSVFTRRPC